jgi:hypothetical protein
MAGLYGILFGWVYMAIAGRDCVCMFIVGAITLIVGAIRASRRVRSNAPTGIIGNDHNAVWCQCNHDWNGDCWFDKAGIFIAENGDRLAVSV